MSHIPMEGYEDAAFFGRNCHPCLHPEDGTPHEAALKCAARLPGSYIIEERDGWTVYARLRFETLSPADKRALDSWLNEPIEAKIARWELDISEGRRDKDGRWVGEPRKGQQEGRGQSE